MFLKIISHINYIYAAVDILIILILFELSIFVDTACFWKVHTKKIQRILFRRQHKWRERLNPCRRNIQLLYFPSYIDVTRQWLLMHIIKYILNIYHQEVRRYRVILQKKPTNLQKLMFKILFSFSLYDIHRVLILQNVLNWLRVTHLV